MTTQDEIASLVCAHLDVFAEIEALDVELRRPLTTEARRRMPPWIMAGRAELAAEELAVWRSLDAGMISDREAVQAMRGLMVQYYG